MKERIIRFNWGTKRENLHYFFGQREKIAKTRGICAAHTCIPQYREYPHPGVDPAIQAPETRPCARRSSLLGAASKIQLPGATFISTPAGDQLSKVRRARHRSRRHSLRFSSRRYRLRGATLQGTASGKPLSTVQPPGAALDGTASLTRDKASATPVM